MFGTTVNNGILSFGLSGDIEVDTTNGFRLKLLDISGEAGAVLIPDFLEASVDARLLIENDRFKELSGGFDAVLFGLEASGDAVLNEHGCLALSFNGGDPVELALVDGACAITPEPDPTLMSVGDATVMEGDTALVPITFDDRRDLLLPLGEQSLTLEYWTMSRPDRDTASATGLIGGPLADDFEQVKRQTIEVPLQFVSSPFEGLGFYRLPSRFDLPLNTVDDVRIEDDETFSVFVNIIQPAPNPRIARGDNGFGTITIENDDILVGPPNDAIVFFDFEVEETLVIPPKFFLERGPDASRPELPFGPDQVSNLTHSSQTFAAADGLLSQLQSTGTTQIGFAASAEEWTRVEFSLPTSLTGGSVPTVRQNYFEFTITPEVEFNEDGKAIVQNIKGIDFWQVAEPGFGDLGDWTVTYSLDGHQHVLASGKIAVDDENFIRDRVSFNFPTGFDGVLDEEQPVTFRITGPNTPLAVDWRIDNLALTGTEVVISKPTVEKEPDKKDSSDKGTTKKSGKSKKGFFSAKNGFLSQATIFFDGNGNRIIDDEPTDTTDALGRGIVIPGPEFDLDGNGQIDLTEGVLVARDGIDITTGLSHDLDFLAPFGSPTITPFTTVITELAQTHNVSLDEAEAIVKSTLQVDGQSLSSESDLFTDNFIARLQEADLDAATANTALMQIHQTARLLASTLTGSAGDLRMAGASVFQSIATQLHENDTVSLPDSAAIAEILDRAATSLGVAIDVELRNAAAEVVAAANSALEAVDAPFGTDAFAQTKAVQKVVFTSLLADLIAAADGTLPVDQLRARNDVAAIAEQAESVELAHIDPIVIFVEDAAVTEPDDGSVDLVFTVRLSEASPLPISVDYQTQNQSASSSAGDYVETSGTLTFAPGETTANISVNVLADDVDELTESLQLQLSQPVHGLLENTSATGLVLTNAGIDLLPEDFSLGEPQTLAPLTDYVIDLLVPGVTTATIDWGDGVIETLSLTQTADGVRIQGTHQYDTEGSYEVILTLTDEAGASRTGRQMLDVRTDHHRRRPGVAGAVCPLIRRHRWR